MNLINDQFKLNGKRCSGIFIDQAMIKQINKSQDKFIVPDFNNQYIYGDTEYLNKSKCTVHNIWVYGKKEIESMASFYGYEVNFRIHMDHFTIADFQARE